MISFMQVSDGQIIQASHLNINYGGALNGGNPFLGGGLQDLIIQSITYHQHVNKDLLEAAASGYTSSYNISSLSSLFGTTNFTLQGTWDNFCKLSLAWISNGDVASSPDPFNPDTTKFTWYLGTDNAPNHAKYTTNLVGVTSFDAKYGFVGIFSHEIYPNSISLTGDVGNNTTFLEHIQDTTIHFRQLNPPTPTSDNDHMASHYGYLNIYDLTTGFIDLSTPLETKRATDDYFFNQFDRNEEDDLERIGFSNTDILHPMLYEEGVYLFLNNKVRQYKIFKADPDDFNIAKRRAELSPMDSLFVGGFTNSAISNSPENTNISVAYSAVKNKYLKTLNTNLDSYWYGNNYIYGLNREWKGGIGERYIEFLMHDGLGYSPRRGMSVGV